MPSFEKGPNFRTPFGNDAFLRSTRGLKFEHYTVSKDEVPVVEVNGVDTKVLRKGTPLAKITSGANAGMVGVRDADATDGRQTVANLVGICNTFVPTQFLNRDVDVAVVTDAKVVQDWCIEYDGSEEEYVEMTDTTAAAIKPGGAAGLAITLGVKSTEIAD